MKRVTYEVLKSLESRIQAFWEDFTMQTAYEYYNMGYFWPKGNSGVRKMDEGLTGREAYYWMQGFLSAYYKIKEGEIPPPRLAPRGKRLWLVFHSDGVEAGCDLIYAPEDWDSDKVKNRVFPNCLVTCVIVARAIDDISEIFYFNAPIDTQGEQDAI